MTDIVRLDATRPGRDLHSLIDLDELQRIQDDFARDAGLAMITVDAKGVPVTRASEFSALCQFLRRDPQIRRRCMSCDAHGGLQSNIEGRPVVYQCHIGLVDFSVSIVAGDEYLGAILCGQVLLKRDQHKLQQLLGRSGLAAGSERFSELFAQVNVVDLDKLHSAADEIVRLVNTTLLPGDAGRVATTGTYLGRLDPFVQPGDNHMLAPLLAGASKPLPLVPMLADGQRSARLDPREFAQNLYARNIAGNLELLSTYLDSLLPQWSQKIKPSQLAEFEDVLIGLATSENMSSGREISQVVIRHRGRVAMAMNRYECQIYCERLLIQLHNLVETELDVSERSISTLLNEIEKAPTKFLTVSAGAEYLSWSDSHFSRKFKEAVGVSFIQYVTAKRLERAKLMLVHTKRPVSRIATRLGFQPLNYFSRQFKKHVGLTPSEYRLQHSSEGQS